jgi:hypothetical protein
MSVRCSVTTQTHDLKKPKIITLLYNDLQNSTTLRSHNLSIQRIYRMFSSSN